MPTKKHRADWMARGPFGMMVHWIPPGPAPEKGEWVRDLDRAVDLQDFESSDFTNIGACTARIPAGRWRVIGDGNRIDLKGLEGKVSYVKDPYKAVKGCQAIAVITEWDLYRNLDYDKIFRQMIKPAFIFDGRNILDQKRCFEIGFNVYPVGKPGRTHFA